MNGHYAKIDNRLISLLNETIKIDSFTSFCFSINLSACNFPSSLLYRTIEKQHIHTYISCVIRQKKKNHAKMLRKYHLSRINITDYQLLSQHSIIHRFHHTYMPKQINGYIFGFMYMYVNC